MESNEKIIGKNKKKNDTFSKQIIFDQIEIDEAAYRL